MHAILDRSDDSLITLGSSLPAVVYLSARLTDSSYVVDIRSETSARVLSGGPETYAEWSWNFSAWEWRASLPEIVTAEKRERAMLASRKLAAIARIIYWINRMRARIATGYTFQSAIHAAKEAQARLVAEADATAAEAAYVADHAERKGIPLREAAEDILLRAQLDKDYLLKTEQTRLALLHKVNAATTCAEVDAVIARYREFGAV